MLLLPGKKSVFTFLFFTKSYASKHLQHEMRMGFARDDNSGFARRSYKSFDGWSKISKFSRHAGSGFEFAVSRPQ